MGALFQPSVDGSKQTYDVDQHVQRRALVRLQQLRRVVRGPLRRRVRAEVAAEGLLAPRAARRVGDGGEGRDGFVGVRVLEEL